MAKCTVQVFGSSHQDNKEKLFLSSMPAVLPFFKNRGGPTPPLAPSPPGQESTTYNCLQTLVGWPQVLAPEADPKPPQRHSQALTTPSGRGVGEGVSAFTQRPVGVSWMFGRMCAGAAEAGEEFRRAACRSAAVRGERDRTTMQRPVRGIP